jgi:hypothetical protein
MTWKQCSRGDVLRDVRLVVLAGEGLDRQSIRHGDVLGGGAHLHRLRCVDEELLRVRLLRGTHEVQLDLARLVERYAGGHVDLGALRDQLRPREALGVGEDARIADGDHAHRAREVFLRDDQLAEVIDDLLVDHGSGINVPELI